MGVTSVASFGVETAGEAAEGVVSRWRTRRMATTMRAISVRVGSWSERSQRLRRRLR